MFQVRFSPKAHKFLEDCESDLRERIIKKLELLQSDPFPREAKRPTCPI